MGTLGNKRRIRKFPFAIVIGVKKCGTSALVEMLGFHPGIAVPENSHVNFFEKDPAYKMGLKLYKKRMPHASPEQKVVVKAPGMFNRLGIGDTKYLQRLHESFPNMKLLMVVRNPI